MMDIFHFYDYNAYKFKLGRQRVGYMDYIGELPDVNFVRSGIGWPNWNNDRDMYENILTLCKKEPDIVIGYIHHTTQRYILEEFAQLPILTMLTFCELREKIHKKLIIAKPDIITYAYPQDLNKKILPNTKWYCLPNAVASSIFCSYIPFEKREIDISIHGAVNQRVYPLRSKMLDAICYLSDKFNCYVHHHPSPKFPGADTNQHLADLVSTLNRSKITCTCSSVYKCRVNKFSEIPMCGSVICSDMPIVDRHKKTLRNCIIEIDPNASVSQIIDILTQSLYNIKTLLKKHQLGLKYASNYTVKKYADELIDIIRKEIGV